MSERSVTYARFTLEREYPHPPDRVFAAFAELEAIRVAGRKRRGLTEAGQPSSCCVHRCTAA